MAFISGSFVPTQENGRASDAWCIVPLWKHPIDLLRGVYLDGMPIWDRPARWPPLAAWGRPALVVSRRFGWEPRER